MIQVILILMDYLKSSAFIITKTASLFKQHPRRVFWKTTVCWEQDHYYYQVQRQMASYSRKRCDFVVFTNAVLS